jgi:hypothetical protein
LDEIAWMNARRRLWNCQIRIPTAIPPELDLPNPWEIAAPTWYTRRIASDTDLEWGSLYLVESSDALNLTMPSCGEVGSTLVVKHYHLAITGTGYAVIHAQSGETIEGAATFQLRHYSEAVTLMCVGTKEIVVQSNYILPGHTHVTVQASYSPSYSASYSSLR